MVVIDYAKDGSRKVSLEGSFFEDLLAILASIRQHADLLSGAEFGFLASFTNDHQAILFSKVGPATVKVFRRKGFLSGKKDIVTVTIDNLEITEGLDDMFFNEIEKLQSAIAQSKRKVAEKNQCLHWKQGAYLIPNCTPCSSNDLCPLCTRVLHHLLSQSA